MRFRTGAEMTRFGTVLNRREGLRQRVASPQVNDLAT